MKHTILSIIFVIFIAFPVLLPLFQPGLPKTDDGIWAVIRQAEMHREIKDIQFPARWAHFLNHGYGYPLFLFTYPIPYYIGEIIHLMGFSLVDTIKLLFFLSAILSGVGMFFLVRNIWGTWGGIIASTVFLYAPYRILNLYGRGSIGELMAWVLFPALFLASKMLIEKSTKSRFIIFAALLACLMLTHNASALLYMPFFGMWILYHLFQHKNVFGAAIKIIVTSGILGLLLSATFWLPAVFEKKYIALSDTALTNKSEHFLSTAILLGRELHKTTNTYLAIGNIFLLLLFIITVYLFSFIKHRQDKLLFGFLLLLFGLSIFLTLPISTPIWELPLFRDLDFPWRIIGISIFLLSILVGVVGKMPLRKYLSIPIILLIIFSTISQIKSPERLVEQDIYFQSNDGTTTSMDELMPKWVAEKPTNRPALPYIINDDVIIDRFVQNSQLISFTAQVTNETEIILNTLYFPGWSGKTSNHQLILSPQEKSGLITFRILPGIHSVFLSFDRTPIRWFADILTVISVGICIWLLFSKKSFLF